MQNLAIFYWSGTGNTEQMAEAIAQGVRQAGAEVKLVPVETAGEVVLADYDGVLFGCPAMGAETLEESVFEPFFAQIEPQLSGMRTGLFGSYGWGDGEWMRQWQDRAAAAGANLLADGLILENAPTEQGIQECEAFGAQFARA